MNEPPVRIARVSWPDLLPWLLIFRALPVALSLTVMVLATLGVAITPMGWLAAESLFITDELRDQDPILAEIAELNRSPYRGLFRPSEPESALRQIRIGAVPLNGPRAVFERMVRPFRALIGGAGSTAEYCYYLFGCLWTVLVWAFVGLGIARVCLLRMTRDERAGLDDAFEFGFAHYLSAVGAILVPMVTVLLLAIPGLLAGLLMGLDWGLVIASVFWFVVLGFAVVMGILLLGLMFGWPLMVCSVACEGQNAFDAITRAYAYVFQRPVNYAIYLLIATLFGAGCWVVATQFTHGVINLAWWSTGLGTERVAPGRIDELREPWRLDEGDHGVASKIDPQSVISQLTAEAGNEFAPQEGMENEAETEAVPNVSDSIEALRTDAPEDVQNVADDAESPAFTRGRQILNFWVGMAKTLCVAFIYALFWCLASAVYLLMRHDVDDTPMDEVFVIDQQRTYELPPLKTDEKGIPQIQPVAGSSGETPAAGTSDDAQRPESEQP